MNNKRLILQNKLLTIMGNKGKVYYQPPENTLLSYPCILFNRSKMPSKYANNIKYINNIAFSVTLITKEPDDPLLDELLKIEHSSFDRQFITNNLYHMVITIII